ncbi:MAG: amino acid adenylation domain-containing protein [Candidatus Promineifilaceae bacterium]
MVYFQDQSAVAETVDQQKQGSQTFCLHNLFEQRVIATPNAIAITVPAVAKQPARKLTYDQLNRCANQIAHRLIELGATVGTCIGLHVERDASILIGILGILKAGCAYVPLDPAAPAQRLQFQMADAALPIVVTQTGMLLFADHAADAQGEVVFIDRLGADLPDHNPGVVVSAESLAYIIYTSGSTGKPKGVMVTHNNVLRLMSQTEPWYKFSASDVWSLFHSYAFDVSVYEMWGALLYGGRIVVVPYMVSRSPEQFRDLVYRERVTMLSQTPSAFRQFITAEMRASKADHALRFVIFAGEALPLRMLAPWVERYGDNAPQLINMYGITETTVHAMFRRISAENITNATPEDPASPIGVPIPDLRIHVLNEQLHPVAAGEIGEIYVAGPGVTKGYLNRPTLTAERYLSRPELDPEPLYKSGDLARRVSATEIDYIGRNDFQVQLRGFRVELGEIEAVLDSFPNVRASIVLLKNDGEHQRLIAYVVPSKPDQKLSHIVLHHHAQNQLADYMIPSVFVQIPEIPLNLNGKRDLRALPEPTQQRPDLGHELVAPRDALETFLAEHWCAVLNINEVGVNDRFFEMGGSSMQAAQFVNRVKDVIGEFIYVVALFEAPTIAEFAQLLRRDYANAIARKFDGVVVEQAPVAKPRKPITPATVAKMRRFIPKLARNGVAPLPTKNRRAMFILAPPRSGTTLLRVMLAGHPELFSSAELLLLNWHTLADRKAAYTGQHALWQEGVIRAIMEIKQCDANAAFATMADYEARGLTTQQMYGELQSWIAPRMLVEKSPAYALELGAMRRAETLFENPIYIHLVRHPVAMINSFVKNHIALVLYLKKHGFDDRTLGELIWTISHQNILTFLKGVPAERQARIQFEQVVRDPETVWRGVCAQIGIPYHDGLTKPYQNSERKMVDGIHKESVPMGDTHFLDHGRINPDRATEWQREPQEISQLTKKIAASLGYEFNNY